LAALPERPDHIVIESSGVADPAGIVRGLMVPEIRRTVLLDGVITVVDAEQALALPDEEAELARTQVASSDLVVVNKVDLVNIAQLVEVQAWIKVIRPGAQVFVATHCRLPMDVLLGDVFIHSITTT
jgi:G3E family GTPase